MKSKSKSQSSLIWRVFRKVGVNSFWKSQSSLIWRVFIKVKVN